MARALGKLAEGAASIQIFSLVLLSKTSRQEIYGREGRLIAIHAKFPVDTGHFPI